MGTRRPLKTDRSQAGRRWKGLLALLAVAGLVLALVLTPGSVNRPDGRLFADEEDGLIRLIIADEDVPIEDFLRAVGHNTGVPMVWNPTDKNIRGKKIIGSVNLEAPRGEMFNLVRALLTFYELVMIPVGPAGYQVQLVMDARATSSILKLKPEYIQLTEENLEAWADQDGKFITTTIRVDNMSDLRNARNALTRIVTGQNIGNVTEVPAAHAFVVTDFAPNVVAIYRLLKEMDVKPEGREVISEFVVLKSAIAEEVEPILTDLFTGRERVSAGQPRRPTAQAAQANEDPEPRIISDPRTNMLILYGVKSDLVEIKSVIERLDVPVYIQNDRVRVVRLKNLEAEDTAEVLTSLIEAASIFGTSAGAATPGTRRAPTGANTSRAARDEEKPAVVADVKSNSLIIAATMRQHEELARVIEAIDVKKDQVLIEAALIELTLDDSYTLAIELGIMDDTGLTSPNSVSGFGFTNHGQTVFADKDGDTFSTDRIPPYVDAGGSAPTGLVGGIFAFGQVPLIFNLLNSVTQSRILQMPSIVTADNEEAVIEVKDEQAYTTSSTTTGGVTNGGLGGFEEAGTTLRISPHISDASFLLLNINLVVSAFVGEARTLADGGVIPADKINRTLITAVTVPDRHTVVLGGLMGRLQRSTVDRTPYLADIPILGEAFKSTNKSDRETSLFLFVTPTIMAGDPEGFTTLDIESCRRKQKADELIGYTEIYRSNFVDCDQDPASGCFEPQKPGCVRGSGSASGDRASGDRASGDRASGDRASGNPASGSANSGPLPGGVCAVPLSSSGSASDRLDRIGVLEATRFSGVSQERLEAEKAARRACLVRGSNGKSSPRRGTRPRVQPVNLK